MRRLVSLFAFLGTVGACGSSGPHETTDAVQVSSSSTGIGSPALGQGGISPAPSLGRGGISPAPALGRGGIGVSSLGQGGVGVPALVGLVAGGGGNVCSGASTSTDPCTQCELSACCSDVNACINDSMCLGLTSCEGSCVNAVTPGGSTTTATTCDQCSAQFPGGQAIFDNIAQCVQSSCSSACFSTTINNGSSSGGSNGCVNAGGLDPGNPCFMPTDCCSDICTGATSTSAGSCN